jgi:protein-S-isoprenylcysteine O-methyltransferase Ste14
MAARRMLGRAGGIERRAVPAKANQHDPLRPASTLVSTGPYKFTRNPMYVSLALLTLAFAFFLNTWWIAVLLVPVLLIVQRFVIVPEEKYLRRRFGPDYEAYTHRVRRWL